MGHVQNHMRQRKVFASGHGKILKFSTFIGFKLQQSVSAKFRKILRNFAKLLLKFREMSRNNC
jgi:hypothetical protein